MSYNPVFDRPGHAASIIKAATDITGQMARDLDLLSQIAGLHRSQAVIALAPDGTILDTNADFPTVLGCSLDEVRGHHHSMFVDETEREGRDYRSFWAALARGE